MLGGLLNILPTYAEQTGESASAGVSNPKNLKAKQSKSIDPKANIDKKEESQLSVHKQSNPT